MPGTVLPHSYGPNEAPAASLQPGVPEKPGRALVHEFLKKVLKLSLIRLLDLSDRLDFEPADRMDIVTQVSSKLSGKHCMQLPVHGTLSSGDGLRLGLKVCCEAAHCMV